MRVLALDGSPEGHGHTASVLREVLAGASAGGAETGFVSLREIDVDTAIARVDGADALVMGTPVYRASFSFTLKTLLDHIPRGLHGEDQAPLQGKAIAVVATGASLHHFLAVDDLRNVLATFFAAYVVPPGLYVAREDFAEDGRILPAIAERAHQQGLALAELAAALATSLTLRGLQPQA